jgi:hypothetical protein
LPGATRPNTKDKITVNALLTTITRRTASCTAVVALTGCAFLAMVGVAAASTPQAATSVANAATDIHPDVVDKGFYSVQETITNNTDADWTFNAQNTNEGYDNHWQQRPQQTLYAHTREVVSGYTDDYLDGQAMQVAYTMPNGDYVLSSYNHEDLADSLFVSSRTGIFTENPTDFPAPVTDPAYSSTDNPGSGNHTDATFTVVAVS